MGIPMIKGAYFPINVINLWENKHFYYGHPKKIRFLFKCGG